MAKAPDTAHARVEALLGSGWMVNQQERRDIVNIVKDLEHRINVVKATSEAVDVGRLGVIREVYDRVAAVMEGADAPGEVGAYWIGACIGVILTMDQEERLRHG